MSDLKWKKYHPLSDKNAFICLVDHMGDDTTIAERARTSYNRDGKSFRQLRLKKWSDRLGFNLRDYDVLNPGDDTVIITSDDGKRTIYKETAEDRRFWTEIAPELSKAHKDDAGLVRRLMRDQHTSPFEMVEMVFLVQVPMDCWRQWVRHRTASINEYSTRYTEALDFFQVTSPQEWRLQSKDNKQGSSGYLTGDIGDCISVEDYQSLVLDTNEYQFGSKTDAGHLLSTEESLFHKIAKNLYDLRLKFGIAKEQARKDLPLSTYTRAYWKCDLHNIFNFLRLRMDSHAQQEIRFFANSMFDIIKQLCPVACEAFEDYVLHAKKFSRMEMEMLHANFNLTDVAWSKPDNMVESEWKQFLAKLS